MKHSELIEKIAKKTGKVPKQRELAKIINKPIGTINSRASRDLKYGYDEIEKIKKFYGVDFNIESIKQDFLAKRTDYLNQKDEFTAEYYPDIFGSCGTGTFVLSECKEKMSVPKKLVKNYNAVKKYSVINAYGDSMSPYIQDKDMLVVEHLEGNEQIKDNRIYVFRYGDKIFIKRLVLNINQLVIKSDNSIYQPITLELSDDTDIQIIGMIVGLMRNTL